MTVTNLVSLLPHQPPGLMLDRATFEADGDLVAEQRIPLKHPMLDGHFPDCQIWPGVLLIEAMAQGTALMLLGLRGALRPGEMPVLGAVDTRLLAPVLPGDDIRYVVTLTKRVANKGLFSVVATREDEVVARGKISAGIMENTILGNRTPKTAKEAL